MDRTIVNSDRLGGDWARRLAISINCAYGDPLIRQQEEDTADKLSQLAESGHLAPFGFCTKGLLGERAAALFSALPESRGHVFRYSLTGLDEAGFPFEERVDTIRRMGEIFGRERIIISPRPIIAGRNDDEATLARIVDVAAETSRTLIIGGLHDAYKHKLLAERVDRFLRSYCDASGVRYFYKSSCSSAFVTGSACWMHDLGQPCNLEALDELGFRYELDDSGDGRAQRIVLDQATTGDLNFVRAVTASMPAARRLVSNYNALSRGPVGFEIEHTSSWYVWARNLPQCLNCDYCIINDIEYLEQQRRDIGAHPADLAGHLRGAPVRLPLSVKGGLAKPSAEKGPVTTYNSVRVRKECRRHAYPATVPAPSRPRAPAPHEAVSLISNESD